MAKTSKDITSFEGGLINAVEPSDSGEENGMYNVENLEGLTKKGVLMPSGVLEDRTTGLYTMGGGLQVSGGGYNVMQSDWEYNSERLIKFTFNHTGLPADVRINDTGTVSEFQTDWEYQSGDGTHPTWHAGSYEGGAMVCTWNGSSSNNGHGKIGNFSIPADVMSTQNLFESNTFYRIQVISYTCKSSNGDELDTTEELFLDYDPANSPVSGPLDGSCYIAPLNQPPTVGGDLVWETMFGNAGKPIGNRTVLGYDVYNTKTYYMVTKGLLNGDELHFGAYFDAHVNHGAATDRGVALKSITIDVAEKYNGTEYWFHSKDDGQISVHENEEVATLDTITVQNSAVAGNDPDFLHSSNVARIQGTNFSDYASILSPKWFGMVRRNYYKYVSDGDEYNQNWLQEGVWTNGSDTSGTWYELNIDPTNSADDHWNYAWTDSDNYAPTANKVPFQFETKLHGWETEDTKLEAPDPQFCTLVNVNDTEQLCNYTSHALNTQWYNEDTDHGSWYGQDLMSGDGTYHKHFVTAGGGYLLRLEYYCDKKEAGATPVAEDITGTWNEAEDTEAPAVDGELDIKYRFYCSFTYDLGSQESVMTKITHCTQAGDVFQGPGAPQEMKDIYTSTDPEYNRTEIELMGFVKTDSATPATKMHDTRVTFRPMVIPSAMGVHGWDLPKRCSGVNWYYSTDKDNHTSRWKLIETDFVKGIKPHSSANAAYLPWQLLRYAWAGFYAYSASSAAARYNHSCWTPFTGDIENRFPLHQGYSHDNGNNHNGLGNFLQFDDPPKFEDWNSIYGSSPDEVDDIYYKASTIIGSQAFYGNVLINGESYRDRILVSIANHGYDMIPFDNYLDVAAGDGDEIISLLTHSEKLYVFKRRSLQVVSVGEESDETVATSAIGGIHNKHHAIATNIGIIWANEYGVFLHSEGAVENLIQGKINDFGLNNSDRFVVGYSPRYSRVFILSSSVAGTEKVLHMIDTNDKTWWRSVGSAEDAQDYSNFITDKDMKLTLLKNMNDITGWGVIRQEWTPFPRSQAVLFEVGDLNLGGVTSKKQLYSIVTVSRNASSLTIVAQQTAPDGSKTSITLSPANLSASATGFGKVEHIVAADTAEDLLFANATISGTAAADMEIHSISFIYRDKGVK